MEIEEVGHPINFNWDKCKLETVSFGHGITTTPLQATSVYASLVNGGLEIEPSLIKRNKEIEGKRLISKKTSESIINILRKVVTEQEGTASLANVNGYYVGGKTELHKIIKIKMKI